MTSFLKLKESLEDPEEQNKTVVRVTTGCWSDRRGMHIKKSVNLLRRLSKGVNALEYDCDCIGATEVFPRIVNLNDVEDGIYEVVICNEGKDWETGSIDEWDYMLRSYNV